MATLRKFCVTFAWGAQGIDPADGRKKVILEPFYLGINKEVATADVENFLEKHIANMTWFISDGGVAYQGWVNKTEKSLKHYVANHSPIHLCVKMSSMKIFQEA